MNTQSSNSDESLEIVLITPVPRNSPKGNRITTDRWERILSSLGHSVRVRELYEERDDPDLMIAIHARRSAHSIKAFRNSHPDKPIVLALAGTDVYRDIHEDEQARSALHDADYYVTLQPKAIEELPVELRDRAQVIFQSINQVPEGIEPPGDKFLITVIGHLRSVKDPLRAVRALKNTPDSSGIQLVQIGSVLETCFEEQVRELARETERYQWKGKLPRAETLEWIARSHVTINSSRMEGGAHVVSEAIACETPVLASEIAGNVGMLGDDYPGYFPVEDTKQLSELMLRAGERSSFYEDLKQSIRKRKWIVEPAEEQRRWNQLLQSIRSKGVKLADGSSPI